MIIILKFIQPSNVNTKVKFEDINSCPVCNTIISPIYISSRTHLNNTAFSIYCECTSCGKSFIVYFKNLTKLPGSNIIEYLAENIEYFAPVFPNIRKFDDKIISLSSNFIDTYNQSLSAETYNLNQIAGMGYRKALEFLVKDYCIYKNPDKKDEILNMFLGNCINTYIDDIKIKSITKVSVWLGNDETHYVKKFEDKDINDLKRFIDTAVYFILYNLNADEADIIISSN